MHEVFISYAREDVIKAKQLYQDLRREGIDAWLDSENLLPGSNWAIELKKAIRTSQYVILLLSMKSMTKRGYVHREIREALTVMSEMPENDTFLIPARLEECEATHEGLKSLHWVDLFPDWDYGVFKIIKSLQRRNLTSNSGEQKLQNSNITARLRGDTIKLPGRETQPLAMIAVNREAIDEMARYLATRNIKALFNVIKAERGTMVPAGTLVEIIEWENFGKLKIARIKLLEGDLQGYIVWTISQFLP